jgi:hypothetical protein
LSLQLRHISSYLIWYLTLNKHDELLHEVILFIGYFTVLNKENQVSLKKLLQNLKQVFIIFIIDFKG